MSMQDLAPFFVMAGVALILIGVLAWAGGFGWFGHLPGDIRIERPGFRFYAPITSMILVSIVLSVAVGVVNRFFGSD